MNQTKISAVELIQALIPSLPSLEGENLKNIQNKIQNTEEQS